METAALKLIHVESKDRKAHSGLLRQYFQLRKRVFHDRLAWDVEVYGDEERDPLDEAPCTYTLVANEAGRLVGGARLIPTTQTTLLDFAFDGLVPGIAQFRSPTIWESSRYCVDEDSFRERLSSGAKKANLAISVGNYDYAVKNGITNYIAVMERRLYQFSKNYLPSLVSLGQQQINGDDVFCGLFNIEPETEKVVEQLRSMIFKPAVDKMPG